MLPVACCNWLDSEGEIIWCDYEATSTELHVFYYLQYFIFKKLYMVVLLNFTLFGPLGTVCTSNPAVELGGVTPYDGLYWKALPERAQVYKRVALSQVGVCES